MKPQRKDAKQVHAERCCATYAKAKHKIHESLELLSALKSEEDKLKQTLHSLYTACSEVTKQEVILMEQVVKAEAKRWA